MEYKTGNPTLTKSSFGKVPRAGAADRMTIAGTANKSLVLLAVLFAAAGWCWNQFIESGHNPAAVALPAIVGIIGGFVVAMVICFKQNLAPYLAVPYAMLEGLALGAISAMLEQRYHGIAIQAVALTFSVMGVLLLAYSTGIIKVTERFRAVVIAATGAIALLYLITIVLSLFHVQMPILNDASPLSMGLSLVIIAVAALNLVLDFDIIQTGVDQGAPKYMEWYGAFGLLVTLVWLYMEILRFLAKARR